MPSTESVSHQELVLCACGRRDYKTRDVVDAALWRGDLERPWDRLLLCLEAERHADESDLEFEDEPIDAAAETFRYQRDLITAEETEQWLSSRGLTLDDFGDYFARQYWGDTLAEEVSAPEKAYVAAPEELRDLLAAEVILSGDIDVFTTRLAWRLAAAKVEPQPEADFIGKAEAEFFERHGVEPSELPEWLTGLGRDAAWFSEMQLMEAAYQQLCRTVLVPAAYRNELGSLRMPLTRFETEVIELESRDAAQEALFCVKEDGMSMEEVAVEGRYPYRRIDFLLEDLPPDLQQQFMSVSAGELMNPMARGDGFQLCRVMKKVEPDAEDPAVQDRVKHRLLQRYFGELAAKHVERRLGAVITNE